MIPVLLTLVCPGPAYPGSAYPGSGQTPAQRACDADRDIAADILCAAVSLTRALTQPWQYAVLAAAAILLLGLRRGVVLTLLAAAATGVLIGLAGGQLPP